MPPLNDTPGREAAHLPNQGETQAPRPERDLVQAPSIDLPKGGGAIRGIDEKFQVNPATGSGAITVPIATSPGRQGFGPELALSYDSGAGNGPFGLGWRLSMPAITRKTDKGLPQYQDATESDVYLLSGAEDLVPLLQADGTRVADVMTAPGYVIHPYRPRIEGLFARIERWTHLDDGDVHWRSISKDNVLTIYGKDDNSCIADPSHSNHIFSWLICETRDDKGNAVIYEYKPEDASEVDLSKAHEQHRGDRDHLGRSANRYLKRILYGNRDSLLDDTGRRPPMLAQPVLQGVDWMFEVLFDYGEGHVIDDPPSADGRHMVTVTNRLLADAVWPMRSDPFSVYRSGFEVRTYRLCRRVLMLHHFPGELDGVQDYLVRSTEFIYDTRPVASYLTSVTQAGYVHETDDHFLRKSLPPVEFTYSQVPLQDGVQPEDAEWLAVRELDAASLENLPVGFDGGQYRFVDLDGEGLSGILTEQAATWYYKPNLGDGRFGPLQAVAQQPSLAELRGGQQQLLDLAGDGQLDLAFFSGPTPGFYERSHDHDWAPFRTFPSLPAIAWDDPNLRFIDLTGDGHADLVITEHEALRWYPSLGEDGFGPHVEVAQALDETRGPRIMLADSTQSICLADMSGDGLTDLVRIRNGEVCYWPNVGYGHFGPKITMDNGPWFDHPELFDHQRVQLADVDGSGITDILYLGHNQIEMYFNHAGNAWSDAHTLPNVPDIDHSASVQVVDLFGNGTACLVWSSPLPGNAARPLRYIDLMHGTKPHLLIGVQNNLGAETAVHYAPSTRFYLEDRAAGKP